MGCNSYGIGSPVIAIQEALVVALMRTKDLSFLDIIVLTRSINVKQLCNNRRRPHWQKQAMLTNLYFLRQQGVKFNMKVVPRVVMFNLVVMVSLAKKNAYSSQLSNLEFCNV